MLLVFPPQKDFVFGFQQEVPSDAEGPLPPIHPRISPILPIDSAIEPNVHALPWCAQVKEPINCPVASAP